MLALLRLRPLRLVMGFAASSLVTVLMTTTALAQTQGVVLDTIDVQGTQDSATGPTTGYVAPRTATGTKTDTPIAEIPQSISVVTRQQLDDRSVQSLNEAVNYTAGISTSMYGFDPRYDSFFIRGFDATYTALFRDGLRELNGNLSIYRDEPYGLERITVLRGPSSTLYSQSGPGGVVDLQTKRPTATPFREIEVQGGSFNRYQGNFDIGGPSDQDGRLLYRLTGLYRQSDTAAPFTKDDKIYLAPAFTYNFTPDTSLTLLTEYSQSVYGGSAAYYFNGTALTELPYSDPRYNDSLQKQGRIGYIFEHRFSDALKVRQNFRYAKIDVNYRYTGIGSITGTTANRYNEHYLENVDSAVVDNQIEGRFGTGPLQHAVLAGVDYAFADWDRRNGFGLAPPLDIVSRNYGTQSITDPTLTDASGIRQHQFGVYAQDQIRLGRFILTLGGRHDWLKRDYFSQTPFLDVSGDRKDEKFSGRAGLSYVSAIGLTPYISYSTSFAPTLIVAAPLAGGEPFAPTTAQGKEIGVKYEPPGMRALITLAAFDITQQNVAVYNAATFDYQQIGEVKSRGFEIDGAADLGGGFRANVAYTYMDMEVAQGLLTDVGHYPSGLPRHQASAWGNYTVPESGALGGFGFGLGGRYIGVSYGDNANTVVNPDAVIMDGTVTYNFGAKNPNLKSIALKINGTNLLGQQFTTCKDSWCYRTEDRRVIASLRYRW